MPGLFVGAERNVRFDLAGGMALETTPLQDANNFLVEPDVVVIASCEEPIRGKVRVQSGMQEAR
jgi:hypothetical protein